MLISTSDINVGVMVAIADAVAILAGRDGGVDDVLAVVCTFAFGNRKSENESCREQNDKTE